MVVLRRWQTHRQPQGIRRGPFSEPAEVELALARPVLHELRGGAGVVEGGWRLTPLGVLFFSYPGS